MISSLEILFSDANELISIIKRPCPQVNLRFRSASRTTSEIDFFHLQITQRYKLTMEKIKEVLHMNPSPGQSPAKKKSKSSDTTSEESSSDWVQKSQAEKIEFINRRIARGRDKFEWKLKSKQLNLLKKFNLPVPDYLQSEVSAGWKGRAGSQDAPSSSMPSGSQGAHAGGGGMAGAGAGMTHGSHGASQGGASLSQSGRGMSREGALAEGTSGVGGLAGEQQPQQATVKSIEPGKAAQNMGAGVMQEGVEGPTSGAR